jgi:hypothetical protein
VQATLQVAKELATITSGDQDRPQASLAKCFKCPVLY